MQEIIARKLATGLLFGEGIRWSGHAIVLSDMLGRRVVQVDPIVGTVTTLVEIENQPNGLIALPNGDLIINSMFDRKLLLLSEGKISEYCDLSTLATGYLGDIVDDGHGGYYVDDVGARVLHGEKPAPGRLIYVSADRRAKVVKDQLAFANGVVISPDGRRLYLAETMISAIKVYAIGSQGALGEGKIFADFTGTSRIDGLTMDGDEGVWACLLDSDRVVRVAQDGRRTHAVVIPGGEPVTCTIGGADGRQLFVAAIEALAGKNIFEEMMAKRVRANVWTAEIPFAKGNARP
ncbi:MAG: SMP-30/gluconolactonase/LRE family protein [Gammaproteobacteria bacterium]|nr:SMP-30/gluconolactonase/LRE family protein [Gammaproteobacteria bacterium]